MTENEAPNGGEGAEGQVTTPPNGGEGAPADSAKDGQGEGEHTATPGETTVPFEQRRTEFYTKKGWDPSKGEEQLLSSYEALESKLGGMSELERKAAEYDRIHPEYETLREKSVHANSTEERLEAMRERAKLERGEIDLKSYPTDKLAALYRNGTLGIQDLPSERQYEVQQFVRDQDAQFETQIRTQAQDLATRHPIIKDPEVCALVANQIEKGMVDPKSGKEMTPEEIIVRYEKLVQLGGKQTEERIKKETERLKNGSIERTGAPVTTKSTGKVKTVAEAFRAAVADING